MAENYMATGLDVGTTKVCAVVAEIMSGVAPDIIGVGISPCKGLKKGVVVDLAATSEAIRSAVEKAQRIAGEEVHSAVIGITGEHIACLNSRSVVAITHPGREITEGDIERVLETARIIVLPSDREIIHAIPRWYSVDGQCSLHSPVGMHGNRLEVETHIITGMTSFIQNMVKCVHDAGLSVDGAVAQPVATAECVLSSAERDLGVVLVDIGGGTSDIAIYSEGSVHYSGVIPVGGNHVTRDVAIGLRTSIEEAERVKTDFGYAPTDRQGDTEPFEFASLGSAGTRQLPGKALAEIIQARMMEVLQLVLDHVDRAGCGDRVPAGLVLTGGGSLLRGLPELATQVTGMLAKVGTPSGMTGLVDSVSSPACATAVGLLQFWATHQDRYPVDGHDGAALSRLLRRLRELINLARVGGE